MNTKRARDSEMIRQLVSDYVSKGIPVNGTEKNKTTFRSFCVKELGKRAWTARDERNGDVP